MFKIKTRKKRIAVRLLIGFLILYCTYIGAVWLRAANSHIFIDQPSDIGKYEARKVEVMELKDKVMILKMLDKRFFTTHRGEGIAQCPKGEIKLVVMKRNGSFTEFYPVTDSCDSIFYDDRQNFFMTSSEDRDNLEALWVQNGFPTEFHVNNY